MGIRHLFHKSNINLTYKTYGKLQRLYDIYKSHKQDTVTHKTNPTALRHLLNHIIPNLPKFTTHNPYIYPSHQRRARQSLARSPSLVKGRGLGWDMNIIGFSHLFKRRSSVSQFFYLRWNYGVP